MQDALEAKCRAQTQISPQKWSQATGDEGGNFSSSIQWNLDLTNLYNEALCITNDFFRPGQNYSKMYSTEPRFNEILVITNTIPKRKHNIYLDIRNKC